MTNYDDFDTQIGPEELQCDSPMDDFYDDHYDARDDEDSWLIEDEDSWIENDTPIAAEYDGGGDDFMDGEYW